ncbi:SDR family NAD(P)-dependent oxidoreductase [Paraburkholderia megapolitana]|uniref:NAD(P)-dependent dehydrogenase, short-chain alcohol dehydrogenase family n=1 Tax=Paraburkholderia megapolitana TaxID=420953 RepID=A0A1I3GQF5_9BURK|nr:SDR family oxidoreductase [Paraburkholderia megapolitana]QDQ83005.1 SDR family oxidoreductase [Paraburkholderia megapolitana]SFI25571.1 NAD(P)-dependent dehydrogenase, short-chain alcohol dehydrogenase family [Paraburkholderia megapolitana]
MSILDRFSMRGKVSIVTGGNRGIGRAIAQGLAEAGSAIAIAARDEEQSAIAIGELQKLGVEAISVKADVSNREELEAMVNTVTRTLGPIDVLVNNAGIGFHANALTLEDDEWQRLFSINLDGVWKASQIVGRQMVKNGRGSIINIGSISGLIVNRPQWHSPYGIAKAAVHHLTRSLAAEWAQSGVRVNAIAPGYVKTEIASTEYEDYRHYWRDEVPMQRYATPEEIAPVALMLASDASSFMTGSVLVVDGGYTLW